MPLGFITNETQVNTTTTGNQRSVATTALLNGGYVTVWASDTGDGSGKAIMGQLFAADGSKVGAEFLVNTTTAGDQDLPDVVSMPAGFIGPTAFYVVWQSAEAGGSVIRARRFLEDGTPLRFNHLEAADTPNTDRLISGTFGGTKPSAGLYGSGRVGFVWEAPSGDGDGSAIMLVRTSSQGGTSAPEVVNTTTVGNQVDPRAATRPQGLGIVWESQEPSGDYIRGRVIIQAGTFSEMAVGGLGVAEDESLPNSAQNGDLAIWNSGTSIKAAPLYISGSPDPSVTLNTTPGGVVGRSDIVRLSNGNYMVAYFTQSGDDGSSYSIRAEHITMHGASLSAEFFVPQSFAGAQEGPSIVQLAGGNIVISWASEADALGNFEIKQRLLNLDAQPGTAGDDTIDGTSGNDVLNGLAGNDTINGLAGNDIIDGGPGNDVLDGGADTDRVTYVSATGPVTVSLATTAIQDTVGAGMDTLVNFENLTGSPFADTLTGNGGANVIDGGAGNDLLFPGIGEDSLIGGEGNDILYFGTALSSGDVANGAGGKDAVVLQGNVTVVLTETNLVGIESVSLQSGANATYGDTANNRYDYNLTMADGNVAAGQQLIVNGQSLLATEDLTFDGSAETNGRFLVFGGHGTDDLTGGAGNDLFVFDGTRWGAGDIVDGGAGRDALVIMAGNGLTHIEFGANSLTGIESVSVSNEHSGNQTALPDYEFVLDDGNVAAGATLIVNGSSLKDPGQTIGIDGSDEKDGNLRLFGGAGNDVLTAGDGADMLYGGGRNDMLTGGAGADTFRYDAASDSAGLTDLILDFATGVDKIDLSRIDANTNVGGDQAFTWIGTSAFGTGGAGSAGQLRIYQFNLSWHIEGDTNGDGAGDFTIVLLPGTPAPVQSDFLL